MQGAESMLLLCLRLALLIGVPAAICCILRLIGRAGAGAGTAIGAGIVAGVLLGPGVLGAIAPAWHGQVFDVAFPPSAPSGGSNGAAGHAAVAVTILASAAVFAAACAARRGRARRTLGAGDIGSAVGAAVLAIAFVALPGAILLAWLFGLPRNDGLAVGAAFAAGSGFAGLTLRRVHTPGRDLHARLFLGCSLLGAFAVVASIAPGETVALLLLPAGAYAAGAAAARLGAFGRGTRRLARAIVLVLMSACAAHLISIVDLRLLADGWQPLVLILIVLLIGDDPPAIGACLGWLTFGHGAARRNCIRRFVESQAMGASLTLVGVGVLLAGVGIVDPATPAGAAVLVALTLRGFTTEALLGSYRLAIDAADRFNNEAE